MITRLPAAGFAFIASLLLVACQPDQLDTTDTMTDVGASYDPMTDSLRFPGETHLRNIRQLTFGGNNAEAYWSFDDTQLIFQSDWGAINTQGCDQQFVMNADGSPMPSGNQYDRVSTGEGRTTCGYFLADGRVIFSSTHGGGPECPTPAGYARGRYVWDIFPDYDIYVGNPDGTGIEPLITGPSYDAEPTVSPDGKYILFTSTRTGDLELWRYELETGELLQLTDELGYDGGAFFSRDSQQIVWRASRPTGEAAESYQALLAENQIEPGELNVFVSDIDGTNVRQVTDLPGANWAPFFDPSGEKIIFASNHESLDEGGRIFDLFLINVDGTGMTKLTHSGTFDAFPMFSYDGTQLVFASNRNLSRTPSRDTNIFIADWIETPTDADRNFVSPIGE